MRTTWLLPALLSTLAFAGCLTEQTGPVPDPEPEPADDRDIPLVTGPDDSDEPEREEPRQQPGAPGAREWVFPELSAATIRPGVQMVADGSQCTSNFVFLDPYNTTAYLGFAAHCVADSPSQTSVPGCDPANVPFEYGTPVEVEGASQPATLVYSSWRAMQEAGNASAAACDFNDFAVVQLHPDDYDKVHPSMLGFGGPTGIADPESISLGDKVLSYGATGLRPRFEPTDAREGYAIFSERWSTTAYIFTPGLPGDSGSGVLTSDGLALGILVTVGLTPFTASNGITHLLPAMEYAADHGLPLRLPTTPLQSDGQLP